MVRLALILSFILMISKMATAGTTPAATSNLKPILHAHASNVSAQIEMIQNAFDLQTPSDSRQDQICLIVGRLIAKSETMGVWTLINETNLKDPALTRTVFDIFFQAAAMQTYCGEFEPYNQEFRPVPRGDTRELRSRIQQLDKKVNQLISAT